MSSEAKTIELAEPIQLKDRTIEALTFRPPMAKDIFRLGMPFVTVADRRSGETRVHVDTKVAMLMLADMADESPVTIGELGAFDLFGALEVLKTFFFHRPVRPSETVAEAAAGVDEEAPAAA